MKKMKLLVVLFSFLSGAISIFSDDCKVKGKGVYSIISNSQPAFIGFSKEVKNCKNLNVDWKILVDNKAQTYEALLAPKSPLAGVVVSSAQFGQYNAEGLVKPITKIVKKYRKKYPYLTDDMLIKVNGEIYAIAFVTNLQHIVYRKDLYKKYKLKEPKTYDDVLKNLEILKKKSKITYPFGAAYKSGWNLATEFTNLYLSTGKDFFKKGSSTPSINNKDSIRVLKMMKKLYSYSSPNSLSLASGDVIGLFQNGSIGMMQMWASRAATSEDSKLSKVRGKVQFLGAAKLSSKDPYPVSSLFWDGFIIPKNTQKDPEVTFQLFMELLDKQSINKLNDNAVWLSQYYKPTKYAKGITDTRKNGVKLFPTSPQFALLHNTIGKYLPDYLNGSESDKEVLKKIEKEYRKLAKEKGLL